MAENKNKSKKSNKTKTTVKKNNKEKEIKKNIKEEENVKEEIEKEKEIDEKQQEKKNIKNRLLLVIIFLSSLLLIVATYAWFSVTLNVKIRFFDMVVQSDSGLFISLDAVNYSDSVEVSFNSVLRDINVNYPSHTNQWASGGFWPVSSNGIKDPYQTKFAVFYGEMTRKYPELNNRRFINTTLVREEQPSAVNSFIAFDIFLKNVSHSPFPDNLYFDEGTAIDFDADVDEETIEAMSGIMNSMRFGVVKIGTLPLDSGVRSVQNMRCTPRCEMLIYEPYSTRHSQTSIEKLSEFGINLVDGVYVPTYGVIAEGKKLDHLNGQEGIGIPLDTEHFALQQTITEEDFVNPIFKLPNGITKLRVYVWIEGQDVDSIETNSKGAAIYIALNFRKDLAGYEE
ncbi:MAG: hypothetical protein GX247_02335 [Mollicutes bacterium]|jgi:hypothetical protein|nr:hypothetical protein [Mollicutes bacterium]